MSEITVHTTGYDIEIPNEFITLIKSKQGKDKPFIRFPGLLRVGHLHAKKLGGLLTQLNQTILQLPTKDNNAECIITIEYAVVKGDEVLCRFTGTGDANPSNVSYLVASHIIRMAETRAAARALRFMTDTGLTALEELGENDIIEDEAPTKTKPKTTTKPKKANDPERAKLLAEIDKLVKEKNLTHAVIKDKVSEIRKVKFTGGSEDVSNDELKTIVEYLKTYSPKKEEATNKPLTRQEKVMSMARIRKEKNMTVKQFEEFAAGILGKTPEETKGLNSKDLSDEQLDLLYKELPGEPTYDAPTA